MQKLNINTNLDFLNQHKNNLIRLLETNQIKVCKINSLQLNTIRKIELFLDIEFERQGKDYMLSKNNKNREDYLDLMKRSIHFCAFHKNEIIAVLRLTQYPFEFTSIDEQLLKYSVSLPNNYLEFSRLMTNRKQLSTHCISLIMIFAYEWAISKCYEGVVGISQKSQRRYFHRLLGLNPIHTEPILLSSRDNNEYWIMSANWEEVRIQVFKNMPRMALIIPNCNTAILNQS